MSGTRRTNEEMFALGEWAGQVEHELTAGPDSAAATTLLALLADAKAARNLSALEVLRTHWDATMKAEADKPATGDSRDLEGKP